MPEIGEVARVVHFLRLHLVGKRITRVDAVDDALVYGKTGTSAADFAAALTDKTVVAAGSQVMHLGMTGWVHIRGQRTAYTNYYKKRQHHDDNWPPNFTKFDLAAVGAGPGLTDQTETVRIAFTDPRRFGRIRLVDCPGAQIRQHPPLAANGPDPVVDKHLFTAGWLAEALGRRRRSAVKAALLDQTLLSGIGNWVADEVLFQARLHPEQLCGDLDPATVARLHAKIREVCELAVGCLADSDRFPDDWLFSHRWGRGKKKNAKGKKADGELEGGGATMLPSGERLAFVTVGGRTSCYAPGLQKKLVQRAAQKAGQQVSEAEVTESVTTVVAEKPAVKRRALRSEGTAKRRRT